MTLEEAQANPFVREYASFIYTTPSHSDDFHRFRIVFLLDETITEAKDWANCLGGLGLKLDGDKTVKDAGRLFYGSKNATIIDIGKTLSGAETKLLIELGVDSRRAAKASSRLGNGVPIKSGLKLSKDTLVVLRNGKQAELRTVGAGTTILCPIHADKNPSAFVVESQRGSKGVRCRTCDMTFWTDDGDDYDFEAFEKLITKRQEEYENKRAEVESNPHPLYRVFPKNLDVIVHQTKFLPPLTYQPGLTLVKSPKGSGKTAALSALISDIEKRKFPKSLTRHERAYSVLLIGHRRSLIREAAKRLKLDCYLGIDPDEPFEIATLPHPEVRQDNEHFSITYMRERRGAPVIFHARRFGFAICLDSLHKLREGPKYDVIIIDECEQVITHLLAETLQKGKGTQTAYSTLSWLCRSAKSIYALDADLGQISLHALSVMRPDFWRKDFRIIYNKPMPVAHRRQMLMYKSRTHLQNKLIEAIRAKRRCFVACNSKSMADTLTALLRTEFNDQIKIITITSDTAQLEVESHFIQCSPSAPMAQI